MNGYELRECIGHEEFDYQSLKNCLKALKAPHQKINELLKAQVILRVKKGLYVFAPKYQKAPFSKKLLGNWIYGPSYISLETALAHYGLIPERVEIITSVTSKKDKFFETPIGAFSYRYLNIKTYPLGVVLEPIDATRTILIASPEKALIDYIHLKLKTSELTTLNDIKALLYEDLRIDPSFLKQKINLKNFRQIAKHYTSENIKNLVEYFNSGDF